MTDVSIERSEGVALVRIDRPRANALSRALLAELRAAAEELRAEPPGAVVLTGTERIFSAGADITELDGPEGAAAVAGSFAEALSAWAALPRVTIAAIAGAALGGGLELALACDFRVASSAARLGQPEVLLGIIPGGGATQRLPRLVGASRAKDVILSGRQLGADEALAIGLVDRVVAPGDVLSSALEMARTFAAGAVAAQGLAKAAIDEGLDGALADGLALERRRFVEVFATADAAIGIRSFLEEGPGRARFTGS